MSNTDQKPKDGMEGKGADHNEHADQNEYDENSMDEQDGEVINETETGSGRRRTKRRIKIKTHVRVKKKTSSKKTYKKLFEQLIWVAFIAAFITALVILYQQLGFNDSKYKSKPRTMLLYKKKHNLLTEIQTVNKQNSDSIVGCI